MIENIEFTLNLIRHGESAINATPDIIGQNHDTPLTQKGKEQACALHNRFTENNEKFDFVFSSPYLRALDTALLAQPNSDQEIILAPEIREYHAGDWIGASRSAIFTQEIRSRMDLLNQGFLPPNGESFSMVERRASKWIEDTILYNRDMIDFFNKNGNINIVCFSHGMTIKTILHYVLGFDKSMTWKINIGNTSITKIHFGTYGWSIGCINDVSHLERL